MFEEVLDTFENEDLKELALEMIKTIPPYFYNVGASSTGKYHPAYAVGNGGLYRHTIAVCRFLNYLLDTSSIDSRDKDLLRIAAIMHDSRKSGDQNDYEGSKYTRFDHPLMAAEVVRSFNSGEWNEEEIEKIASVIEAHMGKWNTSTKSKVVLPVPKNKYQLMLHMADYLASRKDICFYDFLSDTNTERQTKTVPTMPFGKHKGEEINNIPIDYLRWVIDNADIKEGWLKNSILKRLNDEGEN